MIETEPGVSPGGSGNMRSRKQDVTSTIFLIHIYKQRYNIHGLYVCNILYSKIIIIIIINSYPEHLDPNPNSPALTSY